jgi:thiamine-monophosphate kinase
VGRRDRPAAPGLSLGPGGEFDLIQSFFDRPTRPLPAGVRIGPGDDCAIVAGKGIALSTDMSVEGVHFRRDWLSAEEIGYRSTAGALSDLAAVAARPLGALVSLAIPTHDSPELARELTRGVHRALDVAGGVLLGGDLTRTAGPLVLDVTVVGEAETPVLRSGSIPGDELWVTGVLGGAAVAVRAWLAGGEPPSDARAAFAAPVPRVREARWLHERGVVRAAIDLSDGLAGDGAHLAAAAGVGIELEADAIPLHPSLEGWAPRERAVQLAVSGGEDYELCFSAPAGGVEEFVVEFEKTFGTALTRVGRVVEGQGVGMRDRDGEARPLPVTGYQHFDTSL